MPPPQGTVSQPQLCHLLRSHPTPARSCLCVGALQVQASATCRTAWGTAGREYGHLVTRKSLSTNPPRATGDSRGETKTPQPLTSVCSHPRCRGGLSPGQARGRSSRDLQPGSGSPGSLWPARCFCSLCSTERLLQAFYVTWESLSWEPRKGRPLFPLGVQMLPACPLPPCVGPGRPCLTASLPLSLNHASLLFIFSFPAFGSISCYALFSSSCLPCPLFLTVAKCRALSKFLIFVFKLVLLFKFLSVSKAHQNVKVYKHNRGLGKLCKVKTPRR